MSTDDRPDPRQLWRHHERELNDVDERLTLDELSHAELVAVVRALSWRVDRLEHVRPTPTLVQSPRLVGRRALSSDGVVVSLGHRRSISLAELDEMAGDASYHDEPDEDMYRSR